MGVATRGRAPAAPTRRRGMPLFFGQTMALPSRPSRGRLLARPSRLPYHPSMRALAWLMVGLLSACALTRPGPVPGRLEPLSIDATTRQAVAAARLNFERGHPQEALVAIDAVVAGQPDAIDAQRLRQDILRSRGRMAMLCAEAAARVAAAPEDGLAHYLQGRIMPPGSEVQRACFVRAAELAPQSPYPWLGLAFALRGSPGESLDIYRQLYEATDDPTTASAYALSLRVSGQLQEAAGIYQKMMQDGRGAGLGALGLSRTLYALGGQTERLRGFAALLDGLRARPFDASGRAIVAELLRVGISDAQVEQLLDVLRESSERLQEFGRDAGLPVLLDLLERQQQPFAALSLLRAAEASAAAESLVPQPTLVRQRRRLLLQVGDVRGFLDLLAEELPRHLIVEPSNQVGALWRSLLEGPWQQGDPLADVDRAVALGRALRDAGLLVETELLVEVARWKLATDAKDLTALGDEVARELAFENEVRRLIYRNYDAGVSTSLRDLMVRIREASMRILGKDVVADNATFYAPLVGEMLDPFAAGLCLHYQRYNRHLVLGRRSGGTPEGLSFTRLSVRDLPAVAELALPGRCREVIGFDRDVRSLSGVVGGDLAGVALLSHYLIDYDAVVEWAAGLAQRRRIVQSDYAAAMQDGWTKASSPLRPLDVGWRLAAMSPLQDRELERAVLEMIQIHERQHLVDSFYYLPFETNLWRGMGLLAGQGFDAIAVEGEMERRAELAALALSQHPGLVLAHIADFMAQDDPNSPHVRGFGQLGRELFEQLQSQGLTEAQAAVGNWHRLDMDQARRAAVALFGQLPANHPGPGAAR